MGSDAAGYRPKLAPSKNPVQSFIQQFAVKTSETPGVV